MLFVTEKVKNALNVVPERFLLAQRMLRAAMILVIIRGVIGYELILVLIAQ